MSKPSITKHTKQGCGWCRKWDRDEKPWLSPSIDFKEVEGGANAYPTFIVSVDGNEKKLVGYKTIAELQQTIRELEDPQDQGYR